MKKTSKASKSKVAKNDFSNSGTKAAPKSRLHRLSLDSDLKVLGAMMLLICLVYIATSVNFASMLNPPPQTCKNFCGNGICEEIVCTSVGCPCSESIESCQQDCKLTVNSLSVCGKIYPGSLVQANQLACEKDGGDLICNTVCSDPGGCQDISCECTCGQKNSSIQVSGDSEAQETAVDYVKTLYCFNNYNSSNLKELNFTKVSDENGGTYEAHYIFNVNTTRLPSDTTAMDVKLVIANGIVSSAKVSRVSEEKDGFCGYSTNGPCASNGDCVTDGCSGQICRSASEKSIMSTCEWKDCYSAENYNLSCKCMSGQCIWN